VLLGKSGSPPLQICDPVADALYQALGARTSEYISEKVLTVLAATYNVNGRLPQESLDPWLFSSEIPDIVAIGIQEIVELTPGQIVSADPMKRQLWQQGSHSD
jgi:hypothetical protein